MPFMYDPDPRQGKLISTLKVHTACLCRLMPTSPEIMQCPTTYIVSPHIDETEKFLRENAESNHTWVFKPDADAYGHGLTILKDIHEISEIALASKFHSTQIARTQGYGEL